MITDSDPLQTLTFKAQLEGGQQLPAWLEFDADNMSLRGIPKTEDVGVLKLQITATDSATQPATATVTLPFLVETAKPLHNYPQPQDVNRDGRVSPVDVLLGINWLNRPSDASTELQPGNEPPSYDVSGDNLVSPLDVLLVINFLNATLG